jgi:hypothetical protein
MSNELTLGIIQEAIDKLPPKRYPKRMKVSYQDYRKFREVCDALGILPELRENVSLGFGMEIIPSLDMSDGQWEMEF